MLRVYMLALMGARRIFPGVGKFIGVAGIFSGGVHFFPPLRPSKSLQPSKKALRTFPGKSLSRKDDSRKDVSRKDVSRIVIFPERRFPDKTFPGQSLSRKDVSRKKTLCLNFSW